MKKTRLRDPHEYRRSTIYHDGRCARCGQQQDADVHIVAAPVAEPSAVIEQQVRPDLPEQWNCPHCNYGEYKNREDWMARSVEHLNQCPERLRKEALETQPACVTCHQPLRNVAFTPSDPKQMVCSVCAAHVVNMVMGPAAGSIAEAWKLTHGDRKAAYGKCGDVFAAYAQVWSGLLAGKLRESLSASDVALCMVGLKLARESQGHKTDNIVDAHGYLILHEEILGGS